MEDLSAFSARPRLAALLDHFAEIADTRQSWKVMYPLREVLFYVTAGPLLIRRLRPHLLVCDMAMTPLSPSIAIAVSNAADRLRRFSRSWRAFAPCMRVGWNSFES